MTLAASSDPCPRPRRPTITPYPNTFPRLRALHSMEKLLASRTPATLGLAGSGLIQSPPHAKYGETTTRFCTSCDRPMDQSSASFFQGQLSCNGQGQQNVDIPAASSGQGALDTEKRPLVMNTQQEASTLLPCQDFTPNPFRGSVLRAETPTIDPPIPPSFTAPPSLCTWNHHGEVESAAASNAVTVPPSAARCSSSTVHHRSSLGFVSSGASPSTEIMPLQNDIGHQRIGKSCTTTTVRWKRPRPRQAPTSDSDDSEHNDQGNDQNKEHVEHQNRRYNDERRGSSGWVSTASSHDSKVEKSGWGRDGLERGDGEVGAQRHWWEGDDDFSSSESEGGLEHRGEA